MTELPIYTKDTIAAISTPQGAGGIAVIRISGPQAIDIVQNGWKGLSLDKMASHTAHWGSIINLDGSILDEVVLTLFRAPKSFTGEDVIEISCHGSRWIQRELINILVNHGARPAGPGEFTQRAFINGKIDLARAEGIADLIASSSKAAHRLAIQQANGNFSSKLNELRAQLIDFASLLELELDFSEEDVEFADRIKLQTLCSQIQKSVSKLAESYKAGRVIKEGIPVVIAGAPNAGKSTLLNAILGEEKAIVTNIPGTTRDVIEDSFELDGILFRFIDTAGLRDTEDEVERIGIQRAEKKMQEAAIILWLIDISKDNYIEELRKIEDRITSMAQQKHLILLNKIDLVDKKPGKVNYNEHSSDERQSDTAMNGGKEPKYFYLSSQSGEGLEELKSELIRLGLELTDTEEEVVVTNARHYHELREALESLNRVQEGLTAGLSGDFIAQDLRLALHHLGTITGTITTPDLLTSIFTKFCIGK